MDEHDQFIDYLPIKYGVFHSYIHLPKDVYISMLGHGFQNSWGKQMPLIDIESPGDSCIKKPIPSGNLT